MTDGTSVESDENATQDHAACEVYSILTTALLQILIIAAEIQRKH